ncbi:TetR family transcriptional regulator [Rhizobium sp. PP-F2F-G38]|uniref:TetR/AcrR family transcriptional regulator n=1 Tax=Ferranicluibacter rubi TaxID=2715133 RepID=A0AA43ZDX0_9HYPH|nr:TetR/AcrR family transcriptional regulator [Ferranicluibacter rubi]PYE32527.1 TetR family transcriptional regulator [Rhizobium sp. PP-WC-1G-195]PYE95956.1 TetR family transcriptional regulator [Rhizobium sp. PP-F2F-G38]TCP88439.1 TetR family transcriptional regulator [Rhizobium sp. PP-CC-2G-626]TCQ22896.1 TetR family transcriptional regulator [Rhizobium sp. PP-CC-3G-465]NHT75794.1 TetR/AcrR family transcriptional regulator [Ferranicluibacter rubi]
MKVSREQMAENRLRILDAASRLFREKGFEAVTVSEVMKAAGLTHGGFYGHFTSKDDLVAQALASTFRAQADDTQDISTYLDQYLTPRHRDNPGAGCPIAGLSAESRHQGTAARAAITEGLQTQIARMSRAEDGDTSPEMRRAVIGSWAAMVGAIILSRAIVDPELSDEVLRETRAWIKAEGGVAEAEAS